MLWLKTYMSKINSLFALLRKILIAMFAFLLIGVIGCLYFGDVLSSHLRLGISISGTMLTIFFSVVLLENVREADEYSKLMLDTIPLSCSLWDREQNILECNKETLRLFDLKNKDVFKEKFFSLSPEYQPCGRTSKDMAREYVEEAFNEGFCRFEWTHQTSGGELLACENTLIRVKHRGRHIVAAYIRDMSELNATLDAMHKAREDLQLALAVAEDNAKAKSEFLDNMNHELRTPMNGILGFLQIALQGNSLEEHRNHLIRAENSAKDLLKIINNVLDFTEIEKNKMKLNAGPLSLADIFGEISAQYALPIKAKGLKLSISYPADLPEQLTGDSQKLKQVLGNLVDNAVKFTEKGKISVRAKALSFDNNNIEMEFYVKDTGIGILPAQMNFLFSPFWQADTTVTRKHGGTGFGLALSKHLVMLLGGRIWAESEFEKGTTIYFTARFHLPEAMAQNPAMPAQAPDAPTALDNSPQNAPAAPAADSPYFPADINVLLVEDIEINQIIAEELLKSMGYMVDIANNGQEALDMLTRKEYDIVLMDIQMPIMDGMTAAKKIREKEKYKNLPIIAVSAHARPIDKNKSLNCGMNDHITKPLDFIVLSDTLKKWLAPISA